MMSFNYTKEESGFHSLPDIRSKVTRNESTYWICNFLYSHRYHPLPIH